MSMNIIACEKRQREMMKQPHNTSHQKRYGQYFSGSKVAELLSALLPSSRLYSSAIDPMAGVGDLLLPAIQKTQSISNVVGVEIDAPVAEQCANRLASAKIIKGDSFCSKQIIMPDGWDLVITNPPYVRYQLQKDEHSVMPSSTKIRRNLCKQISAMKHLSSSDKAFFLKLAQNYSGLSDMAVPSWLLCASLLSDKGVLAIVVPEAWLNREYAAPIRYMLLKCFDNIVVARDAGACWFDNALVRTCLVVAERSKTVSFGEGLKKNIYQIDLGAKLVGATSLIENMSFEDCHNYAAIAELLRQKPNVSRSDYTAHSYDVISAFSDLTRIVKNAKWAETEERSTVASNSVLPAELTKIIGLQNHPDYVSLPDLGIVCGQGLRTGANDFFYMEIVSEKPQSYIVRGKSWCKELQSFSVKKDNIIKVVKNRSNVAGLVVVPAELDLGVLRISDEIRATDKVSCSRKKFGEIRVLSDELTGYISAGETHVDSRGRHFKEYSAVSPNEKKDDSGFTSYWYMLPGLTKRHLPDLCVTRINTNAAECIFVPQTPEAPVAVDANFSTLWCCSEQTTKIAFALLNSSWSKCYLEIISAIMGGGALKVEASHIRKLLFPQYSAEQLQLLSVYADQLLQVKKMTPELQDKIDAIVVAPFENGTEILNEIRILLNRKLLERGGKNDES